MTRIRGLINWLRTVNLPWSSTRFVGRDLDGNMYFEAPSMREHISQTRRTVRYADGRSHMSQYDPNAVPVQWQAWLRHTRSATPTIDELRADLMRQAMVRERVMEIQARDAAAMKLSAGQSTAQTQPETEMIASGLQTAAQDSAPPKNLEDMTDSERTIATAAAAASSASAGQTYAPQSWTPSAGPRRK